MTTESLVQPHNHVLAVLERVDGEVVVLSSLDGLGDNVPRSLDGEGGVDDGRGQKLGRRGGFLEVSN